MKRTSITVNSSDANSVVPGMVLGSGVYRWKIKAVHGHALIVRQTFWSWLRNRLRRLAAGHWR